MFEKQFEEISSTRVYDSVDMRNSRSLGFWLGALSGIVGTFMLCIAVGILYV